MNRAKTLSRGNMTAMTPEQEIKLKTATTWIPLTLAGLIISGAIGGTWMLSNERSQIYGKINQVSSDVKSLSDTVKALAENFGKPNNANYTSNQMIIDCLRTQIANPSWKCIYSNMTDREKSQ